MLTDGPPVALEKPDLPRKHRRQAQVRLNDEQVQQLVADYQAGASIAGVARKYGVCHETEVQHLKRAGVQLRTAAIMLFLVSVCMLDTEVFRIILQEAA